MTPALQITDYEHFTGSMEYHRWSGFLPFVLTDGAKALADDTGCYWLMDTIAVFKQNSPALWNEPFLVITIKKDDTGSAIVIFDDGNENVLAMTPVTFTDFPFTEFKLYLTDGVIMVPSEY